MAGEMPTLLWRAERLPCRLQRCIQPCMRILSPFFVLANLLTLSALLQSPAAESQGQSAFQREPAGWLNIQPAADLKGWTRIAIPPTNRLGRAQWHVDQPGTLVCDGDGGHEMLRYDRELADCIFHVEFRFTPVTGTNRNYNSGVFIRNSAEGEIWHQAQLTMDGGYLFGRTPVNGQPKRMKMMPLERRMKPAGEWNIVELSARGKTLAVWLNGAITCAYDNCEVPRGYIALESEGYPIAFRNLKLKELK